MAQIVGCREGICLSDLRETERIINEAERTGLDLAQITEELEREGVSSFCDSYHALLECIRTSSRTSDQSSRRRALGDRSRSSGRAGRTDLHWQVEVAVAEEDVRAARDVVGEVSDAS